MGRALRLSRRREPLASMAGIVSTDTIDSDVGTYARREIESIRAEEREKALYNSISDTAIYIIQSHAVISNAVKMRAYDAANRRFQDRLPAGMIRVLVDATINQELALRRQSALARAVEAKKKAQGRLSFPGRSIEKRA